MGLERILEPEVMDTEQDALEYDGMDFLEVNLSFAQRALDVLPASGRILDLGTGTARIPILLIQLLETRDLSIDAIDLSNEMLKVAAQNVNKAGFGTRIHLKLVDAKMLPFRRAEFDAVISNSLIHHIPDPRSLFAEAARVLKPAGGILLRDLKRPETMEELDNLVATYTAGASKYQQKLYRDSLRASLTLGEVSAYAHEAGLSGAAIVASSDRHWTLERRWASDPKGVEYSNVGRSPTI